MKKILLYWPYELAFLTWFLVLTTNFPLNEWTTGWDNLQSELDMWMNIDRSLSAVWQEYQGVGLLGGMGHAADLVRLLIMLPLSWVLPQYLLRSTFVFGSLLLGPLGMVHFLKHRIRNNHANTINISAYLGGLYYLCNLGTIQNFWNPFEPYYWTYAVLPWLFHCLSEYLEKGTKRNLLWFFIISVLATPMGYLQTTFFVYAIGVVIWTTAYLVFEKKLTVKSRIRRFIFTSSSLIIANAFWLLPVLYFTVTDVDVTMNAKMNQIATEEVFLSNQAKGSLIDMLLLKGYWLELHDFNIDAKSFEHLFSLWNDYLDSPVGGISVILLLVLVVSGLLSLLFVRTWWSVGTFTFVLVGLLVLSSESVPVLGWVNHWLRSHFELFQQIFRSPFTKWVIFLIFGYSMAIAILITRLNRYIKNSILFGIIGLIILIQVLPMLTGNLIDPSMKVKLPGEYLSLFSFLKTQPDTSRMAFLPIQTYWGWNHYNWGYRGSGFLWYGIKQPILDRAFDVWSPYNETFYHELSTAIYANSTDSVKKVFDKYNVSLALLDESVIVPNGNREQLRIPEIKEIMAAIGGKSIFQEGSLTLWQIPEQQPVVEGFSQRQTVAQTLPYSRIDPLYQSDIPYIQQSGGSHYPFLDITREKVQSIDYSIPGLISVNGANPQSGEFNLVIPKLPSGIIFDARAKLIFNQGELRVKLLPFGELSIADTHHPVWLDYEWIVVISNTTDQVIVQVGDQVLSIKLGEAREMWHISVAVDRPLLVSVYDGKRSKTIGTDSFAANQPHPCDADQSGDILCRSVKLGNLDAGNLIQIKLEYQQASICIGKESDSYNCLPVYQNQYVAIKENGQHWLDVIYNANQSVTGKPEVIAYPLLANAMLEPEQWNNIKYQWNQVAVNADDKISWHMPIESSLVTMPSSKMSIDNCDALKRGKVRKTADSNSVTYESFDYGASCDGVTLPENTGINDFIVRIKGNNIQGRSVRMNIFSHLENRSVIESLLSSGQFDESFLVLAPKSKAGSSLTLETRAFGNIPGKNEITSIETFNIPAQWLQTIQLIPTSNQPTEGNIRILDVEKKGTWYYHVQSESMGTNLIALYQGFDAGWIALQGRTLLPHVKVNGWANGWILDEATGRKTQGEEVTIFYWPQLLEWFGLGLLVAAGGFLTYITVRKSA